MIQISGNFENEICENVFVVKMLIQVVFLIDSDVDKCFSDSPVLLSNAVCRSCFRLLHHFSSEHEKRGTIGKSRFSTPSVKWGYKFFKRNLGQSKIESHKLYDFKLKYFEEFENDVHRRFELSASNRNTSSESKSKQVKSVDSLSRTLTELLADFQWENPDLMSPIKGKRNTKTDNIRTNHVFLFSKCPKNASELKEFTGKQVPDADVFLHSVFPNTLYHQFCQVARLSMHWIDTEHVSFMCNTDAQSVLLVEKAIHKTGGKLTDLNALVKHGSQHYSDINKLYVDDITELEVASLTCKDSANTPNLIPQSSFLNSLLSRPTNTAKKITKHAQDEVTMKIGNLHYTVFLEPAEKERRQLNKKTENKSTGTRNIGNSYTKLNCLQSYSVLNHSNVVSLHLHIQLCYICSEPVNCVQKKKQGEDRHDSFTKLLSNLASNDLDIVFICEDSGQFVLLRPLTISTATLSVIGTESTLLLEKQMLLSCSTNMEKLNKETGKVVGSKDDLINRLVSSVHVSKQNDTREISTDTYNFDASYMDRWIVPGQSETLQKLVTKLYSRISDLDFLSPDETHLLKQLQTCYKQKNKPPGLRDTSTPTTSNAVTPEITDQFELPGKNKASRLSLSRTDMILCKSKAVVRERGQIKDDVKIKPDKNKKEVVANIADFTSEEELKQYLLSSYERIITGETTCIDTTVSSMVTVVVHYIKQNVQCDNIEERCIKLLEETVLTTGALLREKFMNSTDITDEQKIAEYKTQIMLRLEIISTIQNKDQTEEEDGDEEIVGFLRALSFLSEPGLLSKFMETCIVTNYIHSIPQTLGNLYDELMQPLPEELSNILSPDSISPQRSVFNDSLTSGPPSTRTRSHDSVGPFSQPGSQASFNLDSSLNKSRGGRKLMHHYSVDLGTKRQIVVDKVSNKKSEKRSTKKRRESHRHSKDKVAKSLFDKPKDGVKLERRQSVHVMQHSNKTPKKTPKKQLLNSPRRFASPRRKLVADTPSHKQVSHILKRESLLRRHSMADEIMSGVVAESPEKTCETSIRESPTKGKRTKALLRRSFYSAGPVKRTKNLTQYFQLADRIAGRKRQASGSADSSKPVKLLKLEPSSQFKSPDKNSSFLLSQLVASPSPAKTTPRKRNMTPQKLLDSPSQSTRSKLGMSLSTLGFGSPLRSRKVTSSPSHHILNSPVTRQQSSRILVADSDVKEGPKSPVITPEKVSSAGIISFGLDSPSRSISKKISQTPTRKSVRAALFAKSPAATRKESPFRSRGTSSPRTLLQKFSSPTKIGQKGYSVTESTKSKSLNVAPVSLDVGSESSTGALKSKTNNIDSADNIERTPPHMKKITKTPDSFDKWHRRKPRMSQSSPSIHKVPMTTSVSEVTEGSKNIETDNVHSSDVTSSSRISARSSKKRSLILSPEKCTNRSYKRMRTLESESSFMTGSQGFDVSSSFDEMSQISANRSADYFSATNDDVFLSQSDSKMDDENSENLDRLNSTECYQNNSILKSKTFERLLSDSVPFMPWTDAERSESPIFGSSVCNRTRNKSGNSNKVSSSISNNITSESKTDLNQVSPKPVRCSPASKKFSPNVSAKSLMHLIQSPLLKSPDSNASQSDKPRQSGRGERSRRSLKLQN